MGQEKHTVNIPIHYISQRLGPKCYKDLPFFQKNVTSAIFGIGKKTASNAWDTFPKVTEVIIAITESTAS